MPRGEPRGPKKLRLPKTSERRIIALLSLLPRAEPEIGIGPLEADFEVDLREYPDCFVPLEEGKEGFYAEYDGREDHEFLEASHLKVARRVKAHGTWCLEVYETGGADEDGRFGLIWDIPAHYRVTAGSVCSFDSMLGADLGKPLPTHLTPTGAVKVIGDAEIEGPSGPTYHFAGYATVSVGGIEHECMRLFYPYQSGEKPEALGLDDLYVSRAGRVVLLRRYRSQEELAEWQAVVHEHGWQGGPAGEEDFPVGRRQLAYNGQAFYHWFDTLTDLTLGRLMAPEWAPPRKKKRGR